MVEMLDPWLADDPGEDKVFALAGFTPSINRPADQVRKMKEETVAKIRRLGGQHLEGDIWDTTITHVIQIGSSEVLSEKVMGAISAGRWVVGIRYLDKCMKKGAWLESPRPFVRQNVVLSNRRRRHEQGARGGLFWGMRAALLTANTRKNEVYSRIVKAGAGTSVTTFRDLSDLVSQPTEVLKRARLTHVFLDPWVHTNPEVRRLAQLSDVLGLGLHILHYKFLVDKLSKSPENKVKEKDFNLSAPAVQALAEREKQQWLSGKRKDGEGGSGTGKRKATGVVEGQQRGVKKVKEAVITLDSDSDSEGGEVSIVEVLSSDEEEDIQVLEQKLATSRLQDGGGRQYMERSKAKGPPRGYREMARDHRRQLATAKRRVSAQGQPQVISLDTEMVTLEDSDDEEVRQVYARGRGYRRTSSQSSVRSCSQSPARLASRSPISPDRSSSTSPDYLAPGSPGQKSLTDQEEQPHADQEESGMGVVTALFRLGVRKDLHKVSVTDPPSIKDLPSSSMTDPPSVSDSPSVAPPLVNLVSRSASPIPSIEQEVVLFGVNKDPQLAVKQEKETSWKEFDAETTEKGDMVVEYCEPSLPDTDDDLPEVPIVADLENSDQQEVTKGVVERVKTSEILPADNAKKLAQAMKIAREILQSPPAKDKNKISEVVSKVTKGAGGVVIANKSKTSSEEFLQEEEQASNRNEKLVTSSVLSENQSKSAEHKFGDSQSNDIEMYSDIDSSQVKLVPETKKKDDLVHSNLSEINKKACEYEKLPLEKSVEALENSSSELVKKRISLEKRMLSNSNSTSSTIASIKPVTTSPGQSSCPSPSITLDPSSSLLNRLVATLQRRFSQTNEGLSITNITPRTVRFDKHRESLGPGEPRTVPQSVEVDMANQFQKQEGVEDNRPVEIKQGRRRKAGANQNQVILGEETGRPEDLVISLTMLKSHTNSFTTPPSFLLHLCLTALMDTRPPEVQWAAYKYLDHFLILHLDPSWQRSRDTWVTTFLSACRRAKDRKVFRTFDLANTHDLHSVWVFWQELFSKLGQTEDSGPRMLLAFLVKIARRDLELWWKHGRRSEDSLPLLFYLLGGSSTSVLSNLSSSVLQLYSTYLVGSSQSSMLPDLRQLVSMVGLVVSLLDRRQQTPRLQTGLKHELAKLVASSVFLPELGEQKVAEELSLVQPSWLGVMIARCLLDKKVQAQGVGQGLKLLKEPGRFDTGGRLLEVWTYRMCGLQQTHSLFRAHWHFSTSQKETFTVFQHFGRLEEKGVEDKDIRLEEIRIKMSSIVESIKIMGNFANNTCTTKDLKGSLKALYFRMERLNCF